MPSDSNKKTPPVTKPVRPAKQPYAPPKNIRKNFSLGGRRFNGQSTRRGTRH